MGCIPLKDSSVKAAFGIKTQLGQSGGTTYIYTDRSSGLRILDYIHVCRLYYVILIKSSKIGSLVIRF